MSEEASNAGSSGMSCFIVGGTGEIGKQLINLLVKNDSIRKVVLIGRRSIEYPKESGYEKIEQKVVDFDNLSNHADAFSGIDVGFCTLGTTRAVSGADGFVKVDHDYVAEAAKLAKAAGTTEFHLVTSTGAHKDSYFLYTETKGRIEETVKNLDFDHYFIYQPGLLLCDRTEARFGENIMRAVVGTLDYSGMHSISTTDVAKGMINCALKQEKKKIRILGNSDIRAEANGTSTA